jgi:RES domain-containing protein
MDIRRCHCGVILWPTSPALVCSFECLAAVYGGSVGHNETRQAAVDKAVRQARLEAESAAAIEDFFETHGLNEPDPPDRATSKAQVKWAQWQLQRVAAGAVPPCSMERLRALAATPMEGLPEKVGKARKSTKTRKSAKAN